MIVLTPTRELAIQVNNEVSKLKNSRDEFRNMAIYGGKNMNYQAAMLVKGVDVIVGTPGRIMDLQERELLNMGDIETLIIDETDVMLQFGFQQDIEQIINTTREHIESAGRDSRSLQFMLFSATLPSWVSEISSRFMKEDKLFVDMIKNGEVQTSKTVEHLRMNFRSYGMKVQEIGRFIQTINTEKKKDFKCIIFTQTKKEANLIASKRFGLRCQPLHGDISQERREFTFRSFKAGRINCLVATNVAARGLDIPNVDLIIQMSPPEDIDSYIHRSGRTGRAGKKGICVTFTTDTEEKFIYQIEDLA